MSDAETELVRRMHEEAARNMKPLPPVEPPTIHCTELPEGRASSLLCTEWNYYRSQVVRLLAEGHEGRVVLIKGEEIIGIYDTMDEAEAVGLQKYLLQPFLRHQIREREPQIQLPWRYWGCLG